MMGQGFGSAIANSSATIFAIALAPLLFVMLNTVLTGNRAADSGCPVKGTVMPQTMKGNMMDKDRTAICEIMSEMLDNPDECEIYSTAVAYNKLEALVHGARIEAIGWTHADACCDLDAGRDPRQKEVPEMLERAKINLGA